MKHPRRAVPRGGVVWATVEWKPQELRRAADDAAPLWKAYVAVSQAFDARSKKKIPVFGCVPSAVAILPPSILIA